MSDQTTILTNARPPNPFVENEIAPITDAEREVTGALCELSQRLAMDPEVTEDKAMAGLLGRLMEAFPGTDSASVTGRPHTAKPPVTVAMTDERAKAADELQYLAAEGPCLDALGAAHLTTVDDLATDGRWPSLCPQLAEAVPFRALLTVPVPPCGSDHTLNLYSERPGSYHGDDQRAAYLSAAVVGLALTAVHERQRASHLSVALETNRKIGAAMGILMAQHRCSSDEAFTALRLASQHLHRKLRDIADEVVFTGALPAVPMPAARH